MLNRLKGSKHNTKIVDDMKSYKNVELFAKNAPTGSYAAGCPTYSRVSGLCPRCQSCELDN